MSDDAKRVVLARRARFVAAALAGVAAVSCDKAKSEPCLSVATVTTPPEVCLKMAVPPLDAGERTAIDAGADAADGASDAGKEGGKKAVGPPAPPPTPCLSQVVPQPCLKPPPPQVCLDPF